VNQKALNPALYAARLGLAITLAFGGAAAQAQTVVNVAGLADFTGPYADIMKDLTGCRAAVLSWWNAEVGKDMNVTLRVKDYDTRYDTAQTASLWPGIKSELNPVAVLGIGGPDVAALRERLPTDKIPSFLATAAYAFGWQPDQWYFHPRPTYPHEAGAFFEWYKATKNDGKPFKIGVISSEASPAYTDIHKGIAQYAKENPGTVDLVETIYTEVQPVDLSTQVARLVRKGVDVIYVGTNTAAIVATKRALQGLGKANIPLVMSAHNGLPASGKALGDIKQLEGSFEVYAMAVPADADTETRKFFQMLQAEHKLNASFSLPCLMGMSSSLVFVRAFEGAAKNAGNVNITGEDIRNYLISSPISSKQTFGVTGDLNYTAQAPFPMSGLTVNIATVKDGKHVIVESGAAVPQLNKW